MESYQDSEYITNYSYDIKQIYYFWSGKLHAVIATSTYNSTNTPSKNS